MTLRSPLHKALEASALLMYGAAMVAVVVVSAACTEGTPPPKTAAAAILQASTPTACPLGVQGARVTFDETPNGATLTFIATPDHIDEMRERARDAAAMHGPGQRLGQGHEGKHGMGGEHGLKAMQMPATYAGEDDIEGGARIRFTAVEEKDVDVLRGKLRERTKAMLDGCD